MVNKCDVTNCTNGYVTGEKYHLSFFQKTKNFARNGFISLIAKTGQRKNVILYVSATSILNL